MIRKKLKRLLVVTLGSLFVLLGLAGLVLPVLQGWLFLAIGALLLSTYSPRIRGWIDHHTEKYPALNRVVMRADRWIERIFGAPKID